MAADTILQNSGAYVPTTDIYQDSANIEKVDVKSEEFKTILVRLYQNLNLMANVLNVKDSGQYNTLEYINGQTFFPNPALSSQTPQQPEMRTVYRLVINFGALPNTATKSVAHGIICTALTTFTRIYGTASNTTAFTYIPLPYASTTAVANNIELSVDATNVNVRTAANYSAYDTTYIILEYLQS